MKHLNNLKPLAEGQFPEALTYLEPEQKQLQIALRL